MAIILLNGEPREVHACITLLDLLQSAGFAGRRIAVEINREIVPKSAHGKRLLADGDHIEIVQAMGGG